MNSLSTSLHVSVSISSSRSQPGSLCLSLCHFQPISGWLKVLNLEPHHQLAHYVAPLNLSLSSSLHHFLSVFWLLCSFFPSSILDWLLLNSTTIWWHSLFIFCSLLDLLCYFSAPYSATLLPSLPPPFPQNATTQLSLPLPAGIDDINEAGFEIDFLSASFWITLLHSSGPERSSSCSFWFHDIHPFGIFPAERLQL